MFSGPRKRSKKTGQPPGTPTYTGNKHSITPTITVTTYDKNDMQELTCTKAEDCLPAIHPAGITWIDVKGLNDTALIEEIGKRFNLHPLTLEDIVNVEQRPKVEEFDGYVFVTLKLLHWRKQSSSFSIKPLSLVLGKDFVLSFHESESGLFNTIHSRLSSNPNQRLRQHGSDYLLYRLIDAVVDEYFTILEGLGDRIEELEDKIITAPRPVVARTIYRLKRQMLLLRKVIWPMREAISHMLHSDDSFFTKFTLVYMRDVYDHSIQAIDTIDTFRDMLASMLDMYLSSLTNRMNEIMKTLTIITTIFIPITAIASIYGMNFSEIPGLRWEYGYYAALGAMLFMAIGMVVYFRIRKWI